MTHFSMIEARPLPGKKNRSISWRSREGRSVIYQIVAILSALALVGLLVRNTLTNMRLRGIQSGYDFLLQPFGFDISETVIEYAHNSSYFVAFAIGLLNTLKVIDALHSTQSWKDTLVAKSWIDEYRAGDAFSSTGLNQL